MLEFNAERFIRTVIRISQLRTAVNIAFSPPRIVPPEEYPSIPLRFSFESLIPVTDLQATRSDLEAMELDAAVISLDRLLAFEGRDNVQGSDVAAQILELRSRVEDQLRSKMFLHLTPRDAAYFSSKKPLLGDDVDTGFLSAKYDIDETGKCLALSRSTAAVFHLMRTMEVGIRAVARCLGIPDPIKGADKNWGFILREMRTGIDRRNTNNVWSNSDDPKLFEEFYISLDAVRNTWRNPTMHVENIYTEDEAEHIFLAVRGFMKKLASRMDENGLPLA